MKNFAIYIFIFAQFGCEVEPCKQVKNGDRVCYADGHGCSDWICADYNKSLKIKKKYKFWIQEGVEVFDIEDALNKYFKVFGYKFEITYEDVGYNFSILRGNLRNKENPNILGEAYIKKCGIIIDNYILKNRCKTNLAVIVAHEVGHLFGMRHIPKEWNAGIMKPYFKNGECFTKTDIEMWKLRDLGRACLGLEEDEVVSAIPQFFK